MRTRLVLAILVLAAAAGCGSDGAGDGAKQAKISADAYPIVAKYFANDVTVERFAPICGELDDVAGDDRVAAVARDTCKRVQELADERLRYSEVVLRCAAKPACIADEGEPVLRGYLRRLRALAVGYERDMRAALEDGPCLRALTGSGYELEPSAIDAELRRLPGTIKRLRGDDPDAVERISALTFVNQRDATACKP